MPKATSDFVQLREAYREARSQIDGLDGMERDLGLAALRLEATHTYKQLATTAPGMRDEDLAVLKDYVDNLLGGEVSERVVASFDAQAERGAKALLSSLYASLAGTALVGVLATAAGVFTTAVLTAEQLGAALVTAAVGGGAVLYGMIRAAIEGGKATEEAWIKSWGWASALGMRSDQAMGNARALQAKIAQAATGRAWSPHPFTEKARTRAQFVVGVAWVLVALGVALLGWGVVRAIDERAKSLPPTITLP